MSHRPLRESGTCPNFPEVVQPPTEFTYSPNSECRIRIPEYRISQFLPKTAPETIEAWPTIQMLLAAGMDAQQLEGKLVEDVEEARAAWLAEKDGAIAPRCKEIYMQAKEELDRFRRQQVAGGEDPKQGCMV